jgi:hypothetical protein
LPIGRLPGSVQIIEGEFWRRSIARHDRRRLRSAVWTALADGILARDA